MIDLSKDRRAIHQPRKAHSTMKDPTREELLEAIAPELACLGSEAEQFDIEEAIYWIASDYHNGQWSNLYSLLSNSAYHPGPFSSGCEEDSVAAMLYEAMEQYVIGAR